MRPLLAMIALLGYQASLAEPTVKLDSTQIQIYEAVLEVAVNGGFDLPALDGPITLLSETRPALRKLRMPDMPANFAEALDELYDEIVTLDLMPLAAARVTVRDTLDGLWSECNVVFSHVGLDSTQTSAALVFNYGCLGDSGVAASHLLVFLEKEEQEWRVVKYKPLDEKWRGRAVGRLQTFFHTEVWRVPREAYRMAYEYVETKQFQKSMWPNGRPEDDRLVIGDPFTSYLMADSVMESYLKNPGENIRPLPTTRRFYEFPYETQERRNNLRIAYDPRTGLRIGGTGGTPYDDIIRIRVHPDVATLLGRVRSSEFGAFWAYYDRHGAFKVRQAIEHAHYAEHADFVAIGTLIRLRPKHMSIITKRDSLTGREGSTRDYDIADLEVEAVLKGPYSSTQLPIIFQHPTDREDVYSPFKPGDIANGTRGIWLLQAADLAFGARYILRSRDYVMPVEFREAVEEHIAEPPPPMEHRPMTRGAKWKADLAGTAGTHIYFMLGMLDDYLGRRFIEDSNRVERFYCNEQTLAIAFKQVMQRISEEQRLDAEVETEIKQECLTIYHSTVMSAFINSFYTYTLVNGAKAITDDGEKMTASSTLTMDVFEGLEPDVKWAYLAGSYYRYGEGDGFRFANSTGKVKLIMDLLEEFGIANKYGNSGETIPVINRLSFEPSDELSTWVAKLSADLVGE